MEIRWGGSIIDSAVAKFFLIRSIDSPRDCLDFCYKLLQPSGPVAKTVMFSPAYSQFNFFKKKATGGLAGH